MLTKAKNAFLSQNSLSKQEFSISGMIDDNTKEELVKNIEINWKDYIYFKRVEINGRPSLCCYSVQSSSISTV